MLTNHKCKLELTTTTAIQNNTQRDYNTTTTQQTQQTHNHNALPRHIAVQNLQTHCSALRRVSLKSWQRCIRYSHTLPLFPAQNIRVARIAGICSNA